MHIGLHQVGNDVDILVTSWSWWLLNVYQPNDILVIEEL